MLFISRDYNFQTTDKSARILRCKACGSIYPEIFPNSETLGQAYANYYTTPTQARHRWSIVRPHDAFRREYLRRSAPSDARRILDYGCGSGEYLSSLSATGFTGEVWGTDIFKPEHLPKPINWAALDDMGPDISFDWITLGHVLEHVAKPRPLLEQLKGRLAPNGAIWIATPNADSFLINTTLHWARDVDFPRHREVYTREGLTAFLGSLGLEGRYIEPPAVNAALNTLSSLKNVMADRSVPLYGRLKVAVGTLVTLIDHLLSGQTLRLRHAPELVVVCRSMD
ncbi:class I SAM-dependent methyltransferase [Brevundimonas sp.]|uniref:class I SAM-dependent methyltransferase n=1 Tax=Brevundimonas sp. TaxID=1871086 RepID=UPI003A91BFBD